MRAHARARGIAAPDANGSTFATDRPLLVDPHVHPFDEPTVPPEARGAVQEGNELLCISKGAPRDAPHTVDPRARELRVARSARQEPVVHAVEQIERLEEGGREGRGAGEEGKGGEGKKEEGKEDVRWKWGVGDEVEDGNGLTRK